MEVDVFGMNGILAAYAGEADHEAASKLLKAMSKGSWPQPDAASFTYVSRAFINTGERRLLEGAEEVLRGQESEVGHGDLREMSMRSSSFHFISIHFTSFHAPNISQLIHLRCMPRPTACSCAAAAAWATPSSPAACGGG